MTEQTYANGWDHPDTEYHVTHQFSQSGYELWSHDWKGSGRTFAVHRLLAVSEFGFDEVCGNVVHHKNGIKYDNRPGNIEVMTESEHSRLHNESITQDDCVKIREDYAESLSIPELAEKHGFGTTAIHNHLNGKCGHTDVVLGPDHDGPREGAWRNESVFRQLAKNNTTSELADIWDCSLGTISRWKDKHGINTDHR